MSKKLVTLIAVLLLASLIASPALSANAYAAGDVLIGIPDDATNGGRAIKLLESVGLIEVDLDFSDGEARGRIATPVSGEFEFGGVVKPLIPGVNEI